MIWSLLTVDAGIGSALLLRGFVDGVRAGDSEGYLAVGPALLAVAAVATLEKRLSLLATRSG